MVVGLDTLAGLDAIAFGLSQLRLTRETAPLALAKCWHTDRTSQRAVLQALQFYRTVLAAGGNRTGKTWLMLAASIALALGSDHPHARAFWVLNGCDPDAFPKGPGEVCVVALKSHASVKYHRRDIDALLPRNRHWRNFMGKGEASVEIPCPGYTDPAIIWCMSEEQGADAFQGMSLRAVLHDEEGPSPAVWNEARMRVIDQSGWQLMSNTPVNGRTWVWDRFVKKQPPNVAYFAMHTADNPYLPADAVSEIEGAGDKVGARLRGEWEVVEGRVYPEWDRNQHVVGRQRWRDLYPDVPWPADATAPVLPADWPRFRAMDFGSTNPCVVLWAAVDPKGRILVYRLAYHTGQTMAWWASTIRAAEGKAVTGPHGTWSGAPTTAEAIEEAWADPAGAQEIRDLRGMDVYFRKAIKEVAVGISNVRTRLREQPDGHPGLLVIEGAAPEMVSEIEAYRWPDQKLDGREAEVPIKKHDHAIDCLRYLCVGVRRTWG